MSFNVTVQPSGLRFTVERDEPILTAAIRQGVGLPYGCRDGACGSCKCRLLEGRVIHGTHQLKALSLAEEEAGWTLTCRAAPQTDVVVEARAVPGAGEFAIQKMPCRVSSMERVAPDVMVLRLQLPATTAFKYRAGQYIEFILRDGVRRSYSMANLQGEAPGQGPNMTPNAAAPSVTVPASPPSIELHLRHMPGGVFTDHVFSAMKVKEILRMEGPFGSFFLREDSDKPIVLLASGTGFAPIKAIIERMQAMHTQRPVMLYWGCRSKADLYLHDWATQAAQALPQLRYVPVLSEPKPADAWRGRTGLVHQAVMVDLPDLSAYQVYACGAPVMVDAAQRDFTERCGLPEAEFYADAFTSEADKH